MTRALYESFVCVRTITKNAKRKTPGSETASYVCFACPHCKFEVEVPETCVQQRTASHERVSDDGRRLGPQSMLQVQQLERDFLVERDRLGGVGYELVVRVPKH